MAGVFAFRALVNVRARRHLRQRIAVACKALLASAVEPARPVYTLRVVAALMHGRTQETLVDVFLTVSALVTRGARAFPRLDTDSPVLARHRTIGLARVAVALEAGLASAQVMSGGLGGAGGVPMATMVSCEAEVNRKASCIGGVESEARLT